MILDQLFLSKISTIQQQANYGFACSACSTCTLEIKRELGYLTKKITSTNLISNVIVFHSLDILNQLLP